MDEARAGGGRRRHRPAPRLRRLAGGGGAGLLAHPAGAVRREDRRTCRRKGRVRHRIAVRRDRGRSAEALGRVLRRRGTTCGDRGGADWSRALAPVRV